jgi:hypothetical protein
MKALVSPGVVQQSSVIGRRSFRVSPVVRPPCFASVWRDCSDDAAYLTFSNGTTYHYFPPAGADAVEIILASVLGRNFNVRLRRSFDSQAGYERWPGAIPGSAVLIYSFPPYPGNDPGPCPPPGPDWSLADWFWFGSFANPTDSSFSPVTGATGDAATGVMNLTLTPFAGQLHGQSGFTYSGPAFGCHIVPSFTFLHSRSNFGTLNAFVNLGGHGTVTWNYGDALPFDFFVPDGSGTPYSLQPGVNIDYLGVPGGDQCTFDVRFGNGP